jgi:hypothetical protein
MHAHATLSTLCVSILSDMPTVCYSIKRHLIETHRLANSILIQSLAKIELVLNVNIAFMKSKNKTFTSTLVTAFAESRVDNDDRFASFFAKKIVPNDNRFSRKNDAI